MPLNYISKAGKKTPHIGRFWSGCAGAVKHRLEIMGVGLVDIDSHNCMMLRAHQTLGNFELKKCNMTLADHYVAVIKRYCKEQLKLSHLVVADAFFSTRTFWYPQVWFFYLQVVDGQYVTDETFF